MNESKRTIIAESDAGLEIISGGSRTYFCNAHIIPLEKIEFIDSEREVYNCTCKFFFDDEGTDFIEKTLMISNEDLTHINRFKMLDSSLTVVPYQAFMTPLKMYIMQKFRQLEREGKASTRQGVTSSGVIFNKLTGNVEYCINNYSTGDIVAHQLVPVNSSFYTKELQPLENPSQYVRDTIALHYNYITVNILCWCAAVMAKSFSDKPVKNPAIFSYGINNSGKSALHKNIIGRMFDMHSNVMTHRNAEPEQLFCSGQTPATLQRLSSASNVVPMLLDEFKYFKDQRLRDMMSNFIRNSYDQTTVSKAIDYSANMQHYNIIRPTAMTGESNFGDEKAIINRQIIIQHRRFSPEHQKNFKKFNFSKMRNLGYMIFDMLFQQQEWEWKYYDSEHYQQFNIDSRNHDNIEFLYNGMCVINNMCDEEVITEAMFRDAIDHYVAFIISDDLSDVEDMLQILDNHIKGKRRSVTGFDQKYAEVKDGKLYLTFYPVHEELRQAGLRTRHQDVADRLAKVGLLRYKNISYQPMNSMRGHIFELNASEFFCKIKVDSYPHVFKDINIGAFSFGSIQTLLYGE